MEEKKIKEQLDYFSGKNSEVHIVKTDKEWYNCFILSKESDGIYIILERKFGKRTLFVSEVYRIEEIKGRADGTTDSA